jgi:hypothetical protein
MLDAPIEELENRVGVEVYRPRVDITILRITIGPCDDEKCELLQDSGSYQVPAFVCVDFKPLSVGTRKGVPSQDPLHQGEGVWAATYQLACQPDLECGICEWQKNWWLRGKVRLRCQLTWRSGAKVGIF